MATVAGRRRLSGERIFFTSMALAILAMVVIGFAPTYYLRGIIDAGRPLPAMTPLVHLHGLVFSSWILLFVTQTSLVAAGRTDLHRRLGAVGMALAVVMILLGTAVALYGVHRPTNPPGTTPLSWLAIPLIDVPVYGGLIVMALLNRRTPQTHKRLMLIAMIGMLSPAIGRMPWPPPIAGPIAIFGLPDLFLIPLIVWDLKTLGKLHPATIWGGLFLIASQVFRIAIWETDGWLAFASWASAIVAR
ncbi:hypothetical protein [Sphingomonas cavernae]|uniref:DUF2306 domain-containing protein n=1 Tax=Sphingomonas cavernae TaxID=2320861 RepID=A0A418W6F3_9SPHN|nr:hypothetical protein [Sphingomonas cavernae]RJF85615.1 hypothetical protein D3876_17010 [Sphingomonas cavernae]